MISRFGMSVSSWNIGEWPRPSLAAAQANDGAAATSPCVAFRILSSCQLIAQASSCPRKSRRSRLLGAMKQGRFPYNNRLNQH